MLVPQEPVLSEVGGTDADAGNGNDVETDLDDLRVRRVGSEADDGDTDCGDEGRDCDTRAVPGEGGVCRRHLPDLLATPSVTQGHDESCESEAKEAKLDQVHFYQPFGRCSSIARILPL